MSNWIFLIPISILLGCAALFSFFWSLRSKQYEDVEGAANRILIDEDKPSE